MHDDVFSFDCPRCRRMRGLNWLIAGAMLVMLLCNYGTSRQRDAAQADLHHVAGEVRDMQLTIDVLRRQLADQSQESGARSQEPAEKRNP